MIGIDQKATVDLTRNEKQYEFFIEVVKACNGLTAKRKFAYGGAIRGGKTYIVLFIFIYLSGRYPGSKWVVIREDFPTLQKTTIESFTKMVANSPNWRWSRDKGNFFAEHSNGSRIYFMGESITKDPDLQKLLGLECNGFFLEQLEEIAEKTWDIASSRAGSWYIDPMPPAFMFTSFNPTQRWPKEKIHDRYLDDTLPDDFFYQTALPKDNPFVTQDQWNTWAQMGDRYQKQFIEGDWTNFDDKDPKWVYEFDENKHTVDKIKFLPAFPVKLGWDFNREPLTCVAMQMSPDIGAKYSFTHFIKEFHGDMQIRELCTQIRTTYPGSILEITGDSSGNKGDVGFENRNETHYTLIKRYLNISDKSMKLNSSNLEHHDSRLLVNTALSILPNVKFCKTGCPKLISEYKYAKVDVNHHKPGHLLKDRKETNGNKMDLFDGSRYLWQTYYRKFIEKLWGIT